MSNNVAALGGSVGNLNKVVEVFNLLRDVHPDMTFNQGAVLILIAANPGITQRQIMDRTGLADSSTSRIIGILGRWGNRGTGGLNLIDLDNTGFDRRSRSYVLTHGGRRLIDKIIGVQTGKR